MHICRILSAAVALAWFACATAQEPVPPWQQPDVIDKAVQIQLDVEQLDQFRAVVGEFLTARSTMEARELRRGNTTGASLRSVARAVSRKQKPLVAQMNESMRSLLNHSQWPKYEAYRDVLLARLQPLGPGR